MAEVKRKQKERLESAAKRRSTATCSSRDRDMEGIALESVLQRFLNAPESHRRSRTPSPTSSKLRTENSLIKNQSKPNPKRQSWSVNTPQSSLSKNNSDDKKPEKKSLLWRKSGDGASLESEDEDVLTEKEVQKMREVSQRVLHYQSSRGSVSSGDCISPVTSPQRRAFPEDREKLMSVTIGEDVTTPPKSPLIPVSVPLSPGVIGRRHTITLPAGDLSRTDSDEDKFVPREPENESPGNSKIPVLGNLGRIKSVDSYLPCPNDDKGETVLSSTLESKSKDVGKAELLQEAEESLSSSEPNSPAHRQNNQPKRTSRFISFFKRLGEISKTNNREPDSSSVDP